jgi:hypothetical protein
MTAPQGPSPDDHSSWRRLFTPEEANALLPQLIPILEELRARKAAHDETRRALARLTATMRGNGHGAEAATLERRLAGSTAALAAGVRHIAGYGVEIKDLEHGLIDFPSPRDGRVVFLCWRLGEGPIAFWHEVDAGFAGRRPL